MYKSRLSKEDLKNIWAGKATMSMIKYVPLMILNVGKLHFSEVKEMIVTGIPNKCLGASTCIKEENRWIFFANSEHISKFDYEERIVLMSERTVIEYRDTLLKLCCWRSESLKNSNYALYRTLNDLENALINDRKRLLKYVCTDGWTDEFYRIRSEMRKRRAEEDRALINSFKLNE